MKSFRNSRITVILPGIALILAVGRCSPISPSVSKNSLRPGIPEIPRAEHLPDSQSQRAMLPSVTLKPRLMDGESYLAKTSKLRRLPTSAKIVTLSEVQVEELKAMSKTAVQLADPVPSAGHVYLEVSLTQQGLDSLGRAPVLLGLTQVTDKTWILSISSSEQSDEQDLLTVISALQGATLELEDEEPSPSPTGPFEQ